MFTNLQFLRVLFIVLFFVIFISHFPTSGVLFAQVSEIQVDETGFIHDAEYSENIIRYHIREGEEIKSTFTLDLDEPIKLIVEFASPPLAQHYNDKREIDYAKLSDARAKIENEHNRFKTDIASMKESSLYKNYELASPDINLGYEYKTVFNGISLTAQRWVWHEIENFPYVKRVYLDTEVTGFIDESKSLISADRVISNMDVTGKGIVIGIVDSGIDYNHPDLGGGIGEGYKVLGGYDFVNDNNDPMDDNGHGTLVAGVAAANGNIKGIAPDAKLMSYKVLDSQGSGWSSNTIAGIEQAVEDGVDIINLSLGGAGDAEDARAIAVDNATNAGVVCIASAGNRGPHYGSIQSPGSSRKGITVGASDKFDNIVNYSSRGPTTSSFDIKPDVLAPGMSINSTQLGGGYTRRSGTSMAAPHVAGAVALLLELYPDWSPEIVKSILMNNAIGLDYDVFTQGAGRIDVWNAANSGSAIIPGSVSYGLVHLGESIWSNTEVIQIKNLAEEIQTYNIDAIGDIHRGINISFSTAQISLSPGEKQDIEVTATVDNNAVPFLANEPFAYYADIITTSSSDTVLTPFAIVKRPYLDIYFDERPYIVLVHDREGKIKFYQDVIEYVSHPRPESHIIIPLDIGTYDVMTLFPGEKFFVREDITVSPYASAEIKTTDNLNEITILNRDAQGNDVTSLRGLAMEEFFHRKSGIGFYGRLNLGNAKYFSDFSENYLWQWIARNRIEPPEPIYVFTGGLIGCNSDAVQENDPDEFKIIDFNYPTQDRKTSVSLHYQIGMWEGGRTGCARMRRYGDPIELGAPYIQRVYFHPKPFNDYTAFLNIIFDDEISPNYVAKDTDTLEIWVPWQDKRIKAHTDDKVKIGLGPPFWYGKMKNRVDRLIMEGVAPYFSRYFMFFLNQIGDWKEDIILKYLLESESNLIKEGSVHEDIGARFGDSGISVQPGIYTLTIPFSSYNIDGKQGEAKAILNFDTRRDNKNPPRMGGLDIISDSENTNYIVAGAENIIQFKILDDSGIQNTNLYYTISSDSIWTELPLDFADGSYSTAIPDDLPDSYISLRIVAESQSGNSLEYTVSPAFKFNTGLPQQPQLISPSGEKEQVSLNPILTWTKCEWVESFRVQLSKDEEFKSVIVDTSNMNDSSLEISGELNFDTVYYWRVKGYNERGASKWSEKNVFRTMIAFPEQVVLVSPEESKMVSPDSMLFIWQRSSPSIEYYNLKISMDRNFESITIDTTISDTSMVITDFEDGGEFYWRVKAVNKSGPGPYSMDRMLYINPLADMGYPEKHTLYQNYPNPFNPTTVIRYGIPERSHVTISVYNTLGQRVKTLVNEDQAAQYHEITFDASHLPSGVYIYRLQAGEYVESRKMLYLK